MSGQQVIDVHAHAIFGGLQQFVASTDPAGLEAAGRLEVLRNGPESMAASGAMIGARIPQLTQLERRLADMDAAGIDVQLVSPSPSHYYPFLAAGPALEVARLANEAVQGLIAQAPSRLQGLGLVPLQHPELMVEALDHAVLQCGLRGVEISSFAPAVASAASLVEEPAAGERLETDRPAREAGSRDGQLEPAASPGHSSAHPVDLSDPRLEPFWARAEELGAIVFLHPFGCSLDDRLDRFYLSNTVGQPVENAIALSHLIFSGVLDRHPGLVLIAAHGGGFLPTFLGRSDHAWQVRPEAHGCRELPSTYLSKLYFDSLVHTPGALRALVDAVGPSRVVLGSDYPFDMGVTDPVERLQAAGLDASIESGILGSTAAGLIFGERAKPVQQGASQ